jgi:hypothetical protein
MVNGYEPVGVVLASVVTVIVDLVPVVGLALNAAVVPAGRPATSRATCESKFVRTMPTVDDPDWPCFTWPPLVAVSLKAE